MAIRSLKTGQFSRSALVGNPVIMPGSYESIATVTVGSGGSSSISFTSIPGTFSHLQIRATARSTYNGTGDGYKILFNDIGGTSYAYHILIGNGSTASTANNTSASFFLGGDLPAATETSGIFGSTVIDILDYANTNKYKTTRALSGDDRNGSGSVRFISSLFMSTNAITRIDISSFNNGNFAQYSSFALYGVN